MRIVRTPELFVNSFHQSSKKEEDEAQPFNILLVDDDIRYLRMIKVFIDNILGDNGRSVVYAESTEQALAEIRKKTFNIIFTDYIMGDTNGIELARMARDLIPGISVILVTGSPISSKIMDNAAEAGISKIIAKPVKLNILREIIEKEQKKYAAGFIRRRLLFQ